MNDALAGIHYFFSGFFLITLPGLRRFVVIPLLINIAVFIILFMLTRNLVGEFNAWFAALLPSWLRWLSWILWILFIASFFLFFVYAFVTIANIIAAPFNSFLSEKVELHLTGHVPQARS